ncbi:MAG: pyruvate dehydrogenase (acetyl-transferring) E1 component subunit alpha [Planctomycetes bacterium]|nr:pyruvate dehydrogenase (acetyl-transferring) E1 component subunit alpha [Planctomycetota bacterium]
MEQITEYQKDFLLGLYERMALIREFEEQIKFLFLEGLMPGTIHQYQGQEACAVGVCTALNSDDYITSTHRPHGHALAKGLSPEEILKELYGRITGCCKGKGGSMHIGNMEKGMIPAIAIVGGGIPLAAGIGLAFKMQKTSQVVACFFGDGASSEGAFHEGVNLAAIWNLPVVFVCENNLYGASTHIGKVMRAKNVIDRAAGFGIRCEKADGNDVLAVYQAAKQAAEQCRKGEGPVLLELMTYRVTGHSRRDPCHYQPKEEKEWWRKQNPIDLFGKTLLQRQDIEQQELKQIQDSVENRVTAAIEEARHDPEPALDELETDVFV